jgi:tetratricopeptide (TPR) repeat protein
MMARLNSAGGRRVRAARRLAGVAVLVVLGAAPAAAADLEQALAGLRALPLDVRAGNDARRACREARAVERCIGVFDELVRQHPHDRALRYNAALAYVDHLSGHTILRQGWLSTRSIDHVASVLADAPSDWTALYIRGLNNLYWPRWFGRTGRAVTDLTRCVEISEGLLAAERRAYHALAYVALGDAHAKAGRAQEARNVWRRGAERFPGRADLAERLALADDAGGAFVERVRDLEQPIDTDLSFLWAEPAKEEHASPRG